ncbi:Fe2OG dioxygenase domain-containing protein [Citrus sinensis]|nr:probable 2-oxoglutarate-dependent dioxygenase SLC1 isoform X2 [Citrus sinensis]XP_024948535.1 probable 2-oxoglutarate-dependent dioxygenase SLC1 isoform X2 [Citrus sinensis]KAH9705083.1 Fe2OG dioxygenase domain-containing protein [Citrus sinensis]
MFPAIMAITTDETKANDDDQVYQKGVKNLCENGVTKVPKKYILPEFDRADIVLQVDLTMPNLKLPVIDFSELQGPNRSEVLKSLTSACEKYGFFQVVNHGIPNNVISSMIDVSARFFELPIEVRSKYVSSDLTAPVRYGTSFNQNKDRVFCWRDFLKLVCHPSQDVLVHWPSYPTDMRRLAVTYAKEIKNLFVMLMEAILESLGLWGATMNKTEEVEKLIKQFQDGSQQMVVNCYPPCPEPHLTLGMPPHSDYGFLTLLLQDDVEGLQIQYKEKWVAVQPLASSFVVNVGDHLEIFSNGKYRSVLHRVLVNPAKSRISVASLHSLPFNSMVSPSPSLINKANPRRYKETDFACFLEYISSFEPKRKNFLESRKLL